MKKKIRNVFIVLLCAAIPSWVIHLLNNDWAIRCGELGSIILIALLWLYARRSKKNIARVFTAGALFGEGILAPLLFLFLPLPRWATFIFIDPGFNFFLWLEKGFSSDAVTYTTWYTILRSFLHPTINGLVYGIIFTLFALVMKFILLKKRPSLS